MKGDLKWRRVSLGEGLEIFENAVVSRNVLSLWLKSRPFNNFFPIVAAC